MTAENIIVWVVKSLPYSNQIENLEIESSSAIRFDWRGNRYRVSSHLSVEMVDGSLLHSNDHTMLIETIINKTQVIASLQEEK